MIITERQMTLGRDWQGEDLAGWVVSEKLEDVRAFWDGAVCWTRGGNVIDLPPRIRKALPAGRPLDGGIWAGRGRFTEARLAVQFNHWTPECRFIAYDAPDVAGPWRRRIAAARRLWRDVVAGEACQSPRWLLARLREVQAGGGEGLVARHPQACGYEQGRTSNLLKIKRELFT